MVRPSWEFSHFFVFHSTQQPVCNISTMQKVGLPHPKTPSECEVQTPMILILSIQIIPDP